LDTPSQEEGEQVIDPEIARKATEVMIGDTTQGIAQKASLGDRPAAGKSGTSENFFDAWFLGFTPQLVTGVWMGYAEGGQTLDGLLNIGGQQLGPLAPPAVIWQTYMNQVLKDKPIEKFEGISVPQTNGSTSTTTSSSDSTSFTQSMDANASGETTSGAAPPESVTADSSPSPIPPG
jgi:membrane peptidoglycan carboxypeptidase